MNELTPHLDLLFWLKLSAFAITSILGVIAVLHDFREKKDKDGGSLNRWGILTIVGLVVSTLIGVAAQVKETRDQQQRADATSAALTQLTDKNQKLLGDVKALLDGNRTLLQKTDTTLESQKQTYAVTQSTLYGVQRNLQTVGDTISVGYFLRVPLNSPAYTASHYGDYLRETLDRLYKAQPPLTKLISTRFTDKDTVVDVSGAGDKIVYNARFGRDSVLMPGTSMHNIILSQVPFEIYFSKTKPKNIHGLFADYHPVAIYRWDRAKTAVNDAPVGKEPEIHETPMMTFDSAENSVAQFPWDSAIFRGGGSDGMLSALDFQGAFILVQMIEFLPVRFCQFDLQIGPAQISIPMQDVELGGDGGFIYQLPTDFSRLDELRKKARSESGGCPDFQ